MHFKLDWHIPKEYQACSTEKIAHEKWTKLLATLNHPEIGFFRLPEDKKIIKDCQTVADKFRDRTQFFHVGIGGSALGPQCLIEALGPVANRHFLFLNNIDPDHTGSLLDEVVHPSQAVFYIVSKSGTTAETMAAFLILTKWMEEKFNITAKEWQDHFVFCTDPLKGDLRQIANEYGISCLEVPADIGGRFSVLTSVGIFPTLWAGHDASELMKGASDTRNEILRTAEQSDVVKLGMFIKNLFIQHQIDQTVFMPYSSRLKNFSAWFVQLWAESLGKKHDLNHEIIHTGLTPIASYGATDQHSQMQLFMEGPHNKFTLFVEVENFKTKLKLDNGLGLNFKSIKDLSPFTLNDLMKAEFEGTLQAMREASKPWAAIRIEKVDPTTLGAMFLFIETLTAFVGQELEINPFDQPGVEAGKKYAYQWLSQMRR